MNDFYVKWLFIGFLLGYICGFIGKSIEERIFRQKNNDDEVIKHDDTNES